MDRSEHRPAEPIVVTRNLRASSPIVEKSAPEAGTACRAPERGSGVLRELAELTCHWD